MENIFEVNAAGKENKLEKLGEDKVGYLSKHYIISMSEIRTDFPDYKKYKGLRFEIQVRTTLQHASAEIEHERNYKFAGELTTDIKRGTSVSVNDILTISRSKPNGEILISKLILLLFLHIEAIQVAVF